MRKRTSISWFSMARVSRAKKRVTCVTLAITHRCCANTYQHTLSHTTTHTAQLIPNHYTTATADMAEKRTVAAEPSAASLAGYTEVSSPAVYATYGGHEHVREAEEGRGSGRRSGSESAAKSGLTAAVSRSNYGTNGSYTSGSMSRGGGGGGGKQGSPRGRGYGSTSKGTESPGYSMTPIGESSPSLSTKLYAWDVSTSPEGTACVAIFLCVFVVWVFVCMYVVCVLT